MGFPVGYTDLELPKQLLYLLLFLGYVRRFFLSAFRAVGLGDLLDLGDDYQGHWLHNDHHHELQGWEWDHPAQAQRRSEFRAVPAMVIEEVLPVVRFDELEGCIAGAGAGGGDCAVCLSGIGAGDEVRRLPNCRHAFHRGCLDRWMEHDQRTCPLCRAPLIPDDMAGAPLWAAAAGVPDAYDFDLSYFVAPVAPSPAMLRPHELLLTGLGGYQ